MKRCFNTFFNFPILILMQSTSPIQKHLYITNVHWPEVSGSIPGSSSLYVEVQEVCEWCVIENEWVCEWVNVSHSVKCSEWSITQEKQLHKHVQFASAHVAFLLVGLLCVTYCQIADILFMADITLLTRNQFFFGALKTVTASGYTTQLTVLDTGSGQRRICAI